MAGLQNMRSRLFRSSTRFLSTSASTGAQFPPPEAASSRVTGRAFSPEVWSTLQPPSSSALNALAGRISLLSPDPPPELPNLLTQALTHPSFTSLHHEHYPTTATPATNGALSALGNSLLGLFATEWVHVSYPHLPTRVMKAAVSAYVGPRTCADVSQEWGAAPMLRWRRTPRTILKPPTLHVDALSSVSRSILGLTYHYGSLSAARTFAHTHFLSRKVDLQGLIKFRDPKMTLVETVQKFGWERPTSRLLKETGRYSNSPVFVVGVFSGEEKLGEGFGSSLKMAEYRAAEDALHRLYLTRQPPHLVSLPTSAFSSPDLYEPGQVGESEVLYESAGRGGAAVGAGRGKRLEASPITTIPKN